MAAGEVLFEVSDSSEMRVASASRFDASIAGIEDAIGRANQRIVNEVRHRAVANLDDDVVRPDQATGRLRAAVADPQSTSADNRRIVIGVADYLDAKARYWRAVEEGAPGLAGIIFYGWWTRAPRFDHGMVDLEPPMEGENTGRPIVMSVNEPPEGPAVTAQGKRRWWQWSIHHIPEGKFYFSRAWQEVRPRVLDYYREEIRNVPGPSGRPFQFVRGHTRQGVYVRPYVRS